MGGETAANERVLALAGNRIDRMKDAHRKKMRRRKTVELFFILKAFRARMARMLLEMDRDTLRVVRRALEARARDIQQRLSSEPGDDAYKREAHLTLKVLRQIEAVERGAGHLPWPRDRDDS